MSHPFRTPLLLAAVSALAAALPARAQTIEGRAVDRESLQPIPGATIVLVDTAGLDAGTAVTDATGTFRVTAPAAGEFSLNATRVGFRRTTTRAVPLQAGETVAVEVRMAVNPVALDTAWVQAQAQARAGITGRLLDDRTGQPVAEARVTLLNSREQRVGRAQTDSSGVFHFPVRAADGYTIRAERMGYRGSESAPITVTPDDTVQVEMRVATDAVLLAPLTVTSGTARVVRDHQLAGFEWRRESQPFGRYMGEEEIKRINPFYATDVLQQFPSVRVEGGFDRIVTFPVRGGTFSGSRRCQPNLYVDGQLIRLGRGGFTIDGLVPGSSVAAMEVYLSPTMAPGEFPAQEDPYCGVVVIWTQVARGTGG